MAFKKFNIYLLGVALLCIIAYGVMKRIPKEINISIESDGRVLLEGEEVDLDQLAAKLISVIGDDVVDVVINTSARAPMGLVFEVEQKIPIEKVREIHRPLPTDLDNSL